jgi:hypothetical protein
MSFMDVWVLEVEFASVVVVNAKILCEFLHTLWEFNGKQVEICVVCSCLLIFREIYWFLEVMRRNFEVILRLF